MKTDIYLISGFLGAGKTTLIDLLLREAFKPEETVVIENDFGEVSLDSSLIRSGGFAVKELSAGCICCSLTGDFQAAIWEVLNEFSPRQILIEPSGVGKLSDIEAACQAPKIAELAQIRRKITIADVVRCRMYIDNFGEFYEDQIQHADVILLSRTEQNPEKVSGAKKLLASLAPNVLVMDEAWSSLDIPALLGQASAPISHEECHNEDCCCHQDHHHHNHSEKCCHHDHHHHHDDECCHSHTAEEAFETLNIQLPHTITTDELKHVFRTLQSKQFGHILRAKGIVGTETGSVTVQYLPGELNLTPCDLQPSALCIIGKDLNKQALKQVFKKR